MSSVSSSSAAVAEIRRRRSARRGACSTALPCCRCAISVPHRGIGGERAAASLRGRDRRAARSRPGSSAMPPAICARYSPKAGLADQRFELAEPAGAVEPLAPSRSIWRSAVDIGREPGEAMGRELLAVEHRGIELAARRDQSCRPQPCACVDIASRRRPARGAAESAGRSGRVELVIAVRQLHCRSNHELSPTEPHGTTQIEWPIERPSLRSMAF